jgi:hypothetical protein
VASAPPRADRTLERYVNQADGWHLTVTGMSGDARRILAVRAIPGFADGLVSVLPTGHLLRLGFTPLEVGAIVTGTLLGSAGLTIALGLVRYRYARRQVLLGAAALMLATGVGFTSLTTVWPLLVVALLGTLNPSAVFGRVKGLYDPAVGPVL